MLRIVLVIVVGVAVTSCSTGAGKVQQHVVERFVAGAKEAEIRIVIHNISRAQGREFVSESPKQIVYAQRASAIRLPDCGQRFRTQKYQLTSTNGGVAVSTPVYSCFDLAKDKENTRALKFEKERLALELLSIQKIWSSHYDQSVDLDEPIRRWAESIERRTP